MSSKILGDMALTYSSSAATASWMSHPVIITLSSSMSILTAVSETPLARVVTAITAHTSGLSLSQPWMWYSLQSICFLQKFWRESIPVRHEATRALLAGPTVIILPSLKVTNLHTAICIATTSSIQPCPLALCLFTFSLPLIQINLYSTKCSTSSSSRPRLTHNCLSRPGATQSSVTSSTVGSHLMAFSIKML